MEIKFSISVTWFFEERARREVLKPWQIVKINCSVKSPKQGF